MVEAAGAQAVGAGDPHPSLDRPAPDAELEPGDRRRQLRRARRQLAQLRQLGERVGDRCRRAQLQPVAGSGRRPVALARAAAARPSSPPAGRPRPPAPPPSARRPRAAAPGPAAARRSSPCHSRQRRLRVLDPATPQRPLEPVDPARGEARGAAQVAQQVARPAAPRTRPPAAPPGRRRPPSRRPAAPPRARSRSRWTRAPRRSPGRAAPGRAAAIAISSGSAPPASSLADLGGDRLGLARAPAERSRSRSSSGSRGARPRARRSPAPGGRAAGWRVLAGSASVRVSSSAPIRSRSSPSRPSARRQRRVCPLEGQRDRHLGERRPAPRPARAGWG